MNALTKIMEDNNIKREELALKMNVTAQTVYNWQKAPNLDFFTISKMEELKKALNSFGIFFNQDNSNTIITKR